MKRKAFRGKTTVFAGALAVCLLLAGCGGSNGQMMSTSEAKSEAAYDYAEYADEVYGESYVEVEEEAGAGASDDDAVTESAASERKLIRNVSMSVETEQFDELIGNISVKTSELGGYIENIEVWSSSYYGYSSDENGTRQADYVLRIPKESLDSFISLVESGTNVVRREESVEDVTLTYVDMESHKDALFTEQKRLLELLEQAEDMESVLAIEERLTQVRYRIQSMESQLRTYDNQVDYSTLRLHINEVARITAVDKQSVWSEISGGFLNSLYGVGRALRNFLVGVIVNLPYLIVWAAVIAVIVLVIKKAAKRSRRKKELKREQQRTVQEEKKAESKEE